MKWAATAGIMAFILKYLQTHYMPEGLLGDLEISPAAYSGFSFTLGFVIVFRTSQCYNRFWTCATHVNAMRAEWYEAASGLTTFIVMSDHTLEEQDMFCHKVIRYFSLLHSLALQVLADGDAFPVIDLESLPEESLKLVLDAGSDAEGMTARVELVYQWIQALIVRSMTTGLLNVPPPILTRVLQQMTTGMVNYNSVLDIISIPFPFPYAQTTLILLSFYVCFIPIVMCLLVHEAWIALVCGFLSVLCLISVDLVSTEIENPFGQDANDLPCHEFQHKMNKALLNLMHPAANDPPSLCPNAKMTYKDLMEAHSEFSIVDLSAPKFHGGKLKAPSKATEPKPIPVAKERTPPKAERSDGASASSTGGGEKSGPQSTGPQPPTQAIVASGGQENPGYAQNLIMQQATMLGDFVQSNGAVLERMDRTLNTLTTALTQQLSSLSELQTTQILQNARLQRTEIEGQGPNGSRNNNTGSEVPACLSWSSLFPLPASPPGVPGAAAQPAPAANAVVQQLPRRS